jgi:hypothetical protein
VAATLGTTLIFPATGPTATRYAEEARERGESVVAASSVRDDDAMRRFDIWISLPSIYAADFVERFEQLIATHGITRILSPVPAVHAFLRRLLAEWELGPRLIGKMPVTAEMDDFRSLLIEAERHRQFIAAASDGASRLDLLEIAAVLRQAAFIYGESSAVKIAAMMTIFADAPAGDVVEIGSLAGRTAFVLAHLARRLAIGPVLAIDPWAAEQSVQKDSPSGLLDLVNAWDLDLGFRNLVTNLIPVAAGGFGLLRMPAAEGHGRYLSGRVETPWFGAVTYGGRISVLHIDGNHDLAAVTADCALWLPHMLPGGWLILDDYVWAHGNGPQLVGDALLAEQPSRIARSFVCGKALFVKLTA